MRRIVSLINKTRTYKLSNLNNNNSVKLQLKRYYSYCSNENKYNIKDNNTKIIEKQKDFVHPIHRLFTIGYIVFFQIPTMLVGFIIMIYIAVAMRCIVTSFIYDN